jgi:hypothetical protein
VSGEIDSAGSHRHSRLAPAGGSSCDAAIHSGYVIRSSDEDVPWVDRLIGLGGAPDEQRAVDPFWAQTLGVALNSEMVFVGGSAGPLPPP